MVKPSEYLVAVEEISGAYETVAIKVEEIEAEFHSFFVAPIYNFRICFSHHIRKVKPW